MTPRYESLLPVEHHRAGPRRGWILTRCGCRIAGAILSAPSVGGLVRRQSVCACLPCAHRSPEAIPAHARCRARWTPFAQTRRRRTCLPAGASARL